MIRALILIHRWLGVAFCLLFAMWFATGIVMHFVAFPTLTEAERFAGLAPIALADVAHTPAEAVSASGLASVVRVRLLQRSGSPIYLVTSASGLKVLRASDLTDAAISSERLALAIAADHARRRGLDPSHAQFVELARTDQWSVPNGLDGDRPLYRIALDDAAGTQLYVSSASGLVVLDATRRERAWNYVGSVAHWIYPTILRSNRAAWNATVWWLSLIAMIAAIAGAALGIVRIRVQFGRLTTPYGGWQAWHHVLGLISMTFVLTWMFSGWLSMDHGLLFSRGQFTAAEARAVTGAPVWDLLPADELHRIGTQAVEVEWFAIDGMINRRERTELGRQRLALGTGRTDASESPSGYLRPGDLRAIAGRLAPACSAATPVEPGDNYAVTSAMPGAPVYRLVCGDTWFHIDGANGALLEKLDPSRRTYRWLYAALHTFDLPALTTRPILRTMLIVMLCGLGLVFSLTGVVIGWRRLRLWFAGAGAGTRDP